MLKTVYTEKESMDVGKIQRPGHFFLQHCWYRQLNYFAPATIIWIVRCDTTTSLLQLCSSQDKPLLGMVSVKWSTVGVHASYRLYAPVSYLSTMVIR